MRVLIIGGTRFIGAHTAKQLVELGADVTVFHRGQSTNRILPRVRHICDSSAAYPVTNFPNEVTTEDWDVVIHMVMMGEADARAATQALAGRTGHLLMISSGDVYRAYGRLTGKEPGPVEPLPLIESAPLRTVLYLYRGWEKSLDAYAHDYEKILAEKVVCEADNLPWTILRLPKVYGPEDNSDLATIYGFANQPHWRWTHGYVGNVAAAIALAATNSAALGRIYNAGEMHTPTMGERLAQLPPAGSAMKSPPSFDYAQSIVFDTGLIRTELGYREIVDECDAMQGLARGAKVN